MKNNEYTYGVHFGEKKTVHENKRAVVNKIEFKIRIIVCSEEFNLITITCRFFKL